MNEKEIIKTIKKLDKEISEAKEERSLYLVDGKEDKFKRILICVCEEHYNIFADFLDLYQKEKEKNKVIEIYRKDMPKDTELVLMRKEDFDRNCSSEYISKDEIREKTKKLPQWLTEEEVRGIKFFANELLEEGGRK